MDEKPSLAGGFAVAGALVGTIVGLSNSRDGDISAVLGYILAGAGLGLLAARILQLAGAIIVAIVVVGIFVFVFWERLDNFLPGDLPDLTAAFSNEASNTLRTEQPSLSGSLTDFQHELLYDYCVGEYTNSGFDASVWKRCTTNSGIGATAVESAATPTAEQVLHRRGNIQIECAEKAEETWTGADETTFRHDQAIQCMLSAGARPLR